jgi:hypothetical protein
VDGRQPSPAARNHVAATGRRPTARRAATRHQVEILNRPGPLPRRSSAPPWAAMMRRAASETRSRWLPLMTSSRTARRAASCIEIASAPAHVRSASCSSSVSRILFAIAGRYQSVPTTGRLRRPHDRRSECDVIRILGSVLGRFLTTAQNVRARFFRLETHALIMVKRGRRSSGPRRPWRRRLAQWARVSPISWCRGRPASSG